VTVVDTLEYQPAKPQYHPTSEDRTWRVYRFGYYGLQLLPLSIISFWIGPNLVLFHSPLSPGPADYAQLTNDYIPMIAAIKAYRRDFGQLPASSYGLPPEYRPPNYHGGDGEILNTTSITFTVAKQSVLEYEFSPMKEGWIIHSPRYDGPIPALIVHAAPKPITASVSTPTTNAQ